jgi:hypothetical protein
MKYKIVMRKTITDPNERGLRLKRLYEILTKKSDSVQATYQDTGSDLGDISGYQQSRGTSKQ